MEQELNYFSLEKIKDNIIQKYQDSVKIQLLPDSCLIDTTSMLIDYFRHIMNLYMNKDSGTMLKGRRTYTTQHLDRYIFVLNKVSEHRFIPLIDLIKEIRTDLEANRGFRIDKKTVKRIVEHLQMEGLLMAKDVKVTYQMEGLPEDELMVLNG